MKLFLKIVILLIALLWVLNEYTMKAPSPDVLPASLAPKPVSSTFFLTVNLNTTTLHRRLEETIPRVYSGKGHGNTGGVLAIDYDTTYEINRDDIKLHLSENTIAISTSLDGSGNAFAPASGVRPSISVTMDVAGDIGITSTVNLNPNWSVAASTTTTLDVTKASTHILKIPVSAIDDVQEVLNPKMEKLAEKVTAALNATDVRTPVEKAWKNLAHPVLVDKQNSGWLTIKPLALYYSGFTNTDSGIRAVIGVDAIVEGSYGPRPADINAGSLPPFRTVTPETSGFNINFPVFSSYQYLREPLKKEVVGKAFELDNGAKVEVKGAHLYGNGERIVVTLDVVAEVPGKWFSTSGRIYFSGKPVFDETTNILSLQDFVYDLKTKDYLLGAAHELYHESLRSKIAQELNWDFAERLQAAKARANKKLAYVSLKNGASLKGRVVNMKVNGVYPISTGIQIGTVLKGDVSVEF